MGAGLTIASVLGDTAAALAAAGFDDPRRRARGLIAASLGLGAAEVFAHPERVLSAAEAARVSATRQRVAGREPLSRVLGRREFWGLDFSLSPETLDPRQDSETLVEAVLARLPERGKTYRLLDLGTGTGCLLLALLSELPEARGLGIDIAPGAALAARRNAAALGLAGRAGFAVGNWGDCVAGGFDVVVVNPPYIATTELAGLMPEVRDHDPRRALDGGPDGLAAYRAIAADLPRLLDGGGLFVAEIGAGQDRAVAAIVAAGGLLIEGVIPDLAGIGRVVVARRPSVSR